MEHIFLHLVNMSITAGWIALAVMILRLVIKKAPKWITVLLWGLVGLRLILPFSFESVLSLIPSAETIPSDIIYAKEPAINSGIDVINNVVNPYISESLAPQIGESVNPVQVLLFIASIIWLCGIGAMLLYTLISYIRLRNKVSVSIPLRDNIYLCDNINTPFILGTIKPKIYLPSDIHSENADFVIAHEQAHIKRKDHLIKPLGFLLLTIYWFNPVLWIAYVLLCRDIELACDEKVLKSYGVEIKKAYSSSLLECSVPRKSIAACPLAFGEVGVKQRIKTVLNYKRPAFWVTIIAIILCAVLSICFISNPVLSGNLYGTKVVSSDSDIEGVSLSVKDIQPPDKNSNGYIEIEWNNRSTTGITCGESFTLYKQNADGSWQDIRRGDSVFHSIGYQVPILGSFTHSYSLWNISISETGVYKFESFFLRDKGDTMPTSYSAWIEFEVTEIPNSDNYNYTLVGTYSDKEDIYAQIISISTNDPNASYIEVMWTNETEENITTSEEFYIYKCNEDITFTDCRSKDYTWNDLAYIVPANSTYTHKYSLSNIDMSEDGKYCFEGFFSGTSCVRTYFYYPANNPQHTYVYENSYDFTSEFSSYKVYYYNESDEIIKPCLRLSMDTDDFQFVLSGFSSYLPVGKYSIEGDKLILITDPSASHSEQYVFSILDNDRLKFVEEESAKLPTFAYRVGEKAKAPFEDGAIFEKAEDE